MSLDHSLVGVPSEPPARSWAPADALPHARGVGAGLGGPLPELEITTENSGCGGDRGPSDGWQRPDREPDHRVVQPTRPEQALLYRLSGDRNPLHADPKFAARGGFSRPILHGLCTYGVTGRALLHAVCGSDPARFRSMSGRFSRPVLPGDTLVVSIWLPQDSGDTALFQTVTEDGNVVIDHGRMQFLAPGAGPRAGDPAREA